MLTRDQNLRGDSTVEKLAELKPVFADEDGTMTAGNSTPMTDGAALVLLGTVEWARQHKLPVLAYLTFTQTAAVDYVHGDDGLLMAPAYAVPRIAGTSGPDAGRLRLLRDPRGLRLAGAVHVEGVRGKIVGTLAKLLDQKGSAAASSRSARQAATASPPS